MQRIHKLFLLATMAIVGYAVIYGLFTPEGIRFTSLRTFTYLSNIFMVLGFGIMLGKPSKLRTYTSISVLVAITVTGIVYNFVLVPMAGATPAHIGFVNFVTHALSTVLALVNYFVLEEKATFQYRHIPIAMVFPIVYWLVFISIGGIIDFFPYFFMNPNSVGWPMVFVWFGILLSLFAVLSLLLVFYDNMKGKPRQAGQLAV